MSAMCVNRAGVERLEAFPTDALTAAYERQIRQFLLAVRGEGEIKATIRHGYEALTVALGLLESARTHKLVTFDGAV